MERTLPIHKVYETGIINKLGLALGLGKAYKKMFSGGGTPCPQPKYFFLFKPYKIQSKLKYKNTNLTGGGGVRTFGACFLLTPSLTLGLALLLPAPELVHWAVEAEGLPQVDGGRGGHHWLQNHQDPNPTGDQDHLNILKVKFEIQFPVSSVYMYAE